jgi:glyceraldehyde-3-phosphate dehydrogenase/erythrose-4-phosphate dehydrogenase
MNNLSHNLGNVKRMKHTAHPPVRPAVALDIPVAIHNATELAQALHAAFPCLAGRLNSQVFIRRSRHNPTVRVAVAVALDVDHDEIRAFVHGFAQRDALPAVSNVVASPVEARAPRNGGWDTVTA